MMNTRTRSIHVVFFILLSLTAVGRATVFYVSPDGDDSTGGNWTTAFKSLESALASPDVQAGDELRVRRHTYKPQTTIAVDKAVHIFGGYSGLGLERNPATNITAISGSSWLSRCLHVTADATFDGLWIVDGYAVSSGGEVQAGAGMYIDHCRPNVHNCTFQDNYAAGRGAAIYAVGADGAEIDDSHFVANMAGEAGGAIYADSSDLSLTDCIFVQNHGLQ
jgi:predicted outer membrane repeat protein